VHGGESLGDEVDREVGAAHPQVTDKVARLVHAFNLQREKHSSGTSVSYPFLEFRMHNVAGFQSFEAVFRIQIRIQLGLWIRIQEGKNDPQKYKKVKKCHVLKCWMFSFEAEGFSCSLDVLCGGLEICKLQFLIKIQISFSCSFFIILVIKTLDPDRYSASRSGSGINEFGSETLMEVLRIPDFLSPIIDQIEI
jgi:hypothetical protein